MFRSAVLLNANMSTMELGVHLPLIDFAGEGFSLRRLAETVDAARECGFSSVSANDHFLFSAPWLDGPTALAAVVERSAEMRLVTTVSLATLRGPIPLAKALVALDILSDGRVIAGLGPGSSKLDYELLGVPFEERWSRFEEATGLLRALLQPGATPTSSAYYALPTTALAPAARQNNGIPLWIGSWGSRYGLRRVARLADGWLASAYNTTPEEFAANATILREELQKQGRAGDDFPHALVTMWAFVTEKRAEAERILSEILGPLVKRDMAELLGRVCVGSPEHCAELLSSYVRAGCKQIFFWTVGDERHQVERIARDVMPRISS
jgi:alkanesulfonate monooxygenase SsuD/methylene tetrahydromethanopterin reductase-like flavin-dependent oxidoreductase (luciferase family)